jgi:hypothetical protein
MVIVGEWQLFDDGVTRPIVHARVHKGDGALMAEDFLIDSGADRTVFRTALLEHLHIPTQELPVDFALSGIGGTSAFVLVTTVIEFIRDGGRPVRVRGEFAGFTDPAATDLSVLGRDVLDNFDLILSRRRHEILLLAPRHQYRVEQTSLPH